MIRHLDNFAIYHSGTATDLLNGVFASITSKTTGQNIVIASDPDGVSSGQVCKLNDAASSSNWTILRYSMPVNEDIVGVAQRVWIPSLPANTANFPTLVSWRDTSNNPIGAVRVDTTGRLYITGSDSDSETAVVLYRTPSPVVTGGAWYHIESKMVYGSNISVRVEGVEAVNFDHTFTNASNIYQIQWMNKGVTALSTQPWYLKDLVIWDGSGSYNTDFVGRVVVYSCTPDGDTSLNWTPVGFATGYQVLDTAPYNNSIHLDADVTPPAAYVGTLSDLPGTVTSVKAMMTMVRAAKSDGGDGSLQVSIKSGASVANGVDRPITTSQTYWTDVQETDPATSAPWTPTAVNAAELKLNRTE